MREGRGYREIRHSPVSERSMLSAGFHWPCKGCGRYKDIGTRHLELCELLLRSMRLWKESDKEMNGARKDMFSVV